MEQYEQIIGIVALTMGASWASGINLYAAIAMLGFSGSTGSLDLPPDLEVLTNPLVIGSASVMYVVEFFADKVPGFDTAWDTLHTFIRIPAGAMLAAGAVGDVGPSFEIAAAILGGGMATATHVTKASSRAVINTSPEPFSNWAASISEDVIVFGGLWTALNHPLVFVGFMVLFILFMVWVLPKTWRTIKRFFSWLGSLFGEEKNLPAANKAKVDLLPGDGTMSDDRMDRLERLKILLDAGTLTEDEFQQEKKMLLSAPDSP
jgi:hypothetical protein